jgi:biotin operon repressor
MTSRTLMAACGMSREQIERHEALVQRGYGVREVKGGFDLVNPEKEIHRGPFATREAAWQAAEEIEGI